MYHFVTNGIYRFCEWVTRLAYLNLLWGLFTLCGLVVFGIGPSTVAMYSVSRQWLLGNTDIRIFSSFFAAFKQEFRKANLLGFILLGLAAIFYVDFKIMESMNEETSVMAIILLSLLLVFTVLLLFVFPVYVHYDIPLVSTFKYAFLIGFTKPFHTLGLVAGGIGAIFVSLLHVTVIIFFSGSLFAVITTAFALKAFQSISSQTGNQEARQ
ncbi:YesL family protein [Niallia taxi]|uniref:YesL family protein n=1 Tax=Niallia taxi TaxID=2499688 RepID=UPI002E1DA730|nr:YesL family protein [Niallia taxi]